MAALSSLETQEALELAIKSLQGLSLEPSEQNNQTVDSNSMNGADECVELLINEMMTAYSVEQARARATKVLNCFEELMNAKRKKETEKLMKENFILKKAVLIQYEHLQKEMEELQKLKKMMAKYEQQLKALEVKNYALTMHLKQAQQESILIPQRFHPDVF